MNKNSIKNQLTLTGLFLTLGIVYGDIGTSPLYVMKAIVGNRVIDTGLVLGGISCVFWTLTFQTTLKYVLITLRADNHGEGGIFSLYALIRRRAKYLFIPAILGGSFLLSDGIITPAISVTSSIEGLKILNPHIPVVPIVILILLILFVIQRFGTKILGNTFGFVMFFWFVMLAVLGLPQIFQTPEILKALNPWYAFHLLSTYPSGFFILGAVFLCTTGAEALYSDLGHCGKNNIQISWIFVKICLLMNYFGQGAWLLTRNSEVLNNRNPFFYIMPQWFLIPGIIVATLAAIIASQALISGSYTLISEAMRLNFWPKVRIIYPTIEKGQLYIPSINWVLCICCITVVLFFKESSAMESAYGLAIVITMLMTTFLLGFYLIKLKVNFLITTLIICTFLSIEFSFLIANLSKFRQGGWVTMLMGFFLTTIMWIWYQARKIKNRYNEYTELKPSLSLLTELSKDESVPKFATNLVYLTGAHYNHEIEAKILYSILNKHPKRADMYWFIHLHVVDRPYTKEFKVDMLVPGKVAKVLIQLGFRVEPKVNLYFRKIVEELVKNNEIDILSRYTSLRKNKIQGDFRFVVLERVLTYDYNLNFFDKLTMDIFSVLKRLSLSDQKAFELDTSTITVESVPLIMTPMETPYFRRIE